MKTKLNYFKRKPNAGKERKKIKTNTDYKLLGTSAVFPAGIYTATHAENQPEWREVGKVFIEDEQGNSLLLVNGEYENLETRDPKFKNKSGTLTPYAFACGHIETRNGWKLFKDGCWHVRRSFKEWEAFDTLKEARAYFSKVAKRDHSATK